MMATVAFTTIAATALISAVWVVVARNLVRAVLWLAVTLLATAGFYALLGASFLAGVQALVYVGGVITLLIFGAMITRRHDGIVVPAESSKSARAAFVSVGFFGVVAAAIYRTPGLDAPVAPLTVTTAVVGRSLLHEHVLAFEATSFLLLIAMIGAIVLARKRDPGTVPQAPPVPARSATAVAAAKEVAS